MKNMKAIKLFCLLLFLFVSNWAMAESITSPNGQHKVNRSVNFPTKEKLLSNLLNSAWN